ncbi:MAG: hypothetical protein NTW97_00020 [Candidatus Krumholzibacteria bacterium]|nr:hypothetical protein [Candidatus Krumholzibacteria bacterium]
MNGTGAGFSRFVAALAACAFAASMMSSCRLPQRGSPADVGLESAPTGTDLAAAARFAIAGDDMPKSLLKAMPDSGIAAVRVTIRNEGSAPLLIHSANGMKLAAGFEGFALVGGGTTYLPLAPRAVAERVLGAKKAGRYRMRSASSFVAGTFIAPVGAFFMYSEVDVGRYYRPIFNKSFYPAFESGMMKPVKIAPGEERSGYLYFAIPEGARPDSCELLVRACLPQTALRSLPGSGFMFSRDERAAADAAQGFLFMFGEVAGAGPHGLYLTPTRALDAKSDPLWTFVTPVAAKSASIADVSSDGTLAACAVNFQAKGKVYLVRCGEKPALLEEQTFTRTIRRVFVAGGGAFVVTEDAFCHYFDAASRRWARGVKLGIDIDGTAVLNDRLLAFSKAKGIALFDASGASPVARREDKPLRPARRTAIGLLGGDLVLLTRGSSVRCDTLALLDAGAMGEIGRGALPGKVRAASSDGSNLIMQFEDGTIVRIVRGSGAIFAVAEAGYLPFEARTLKAVPEGFIAVGEGGAFAAGPVGSFSPGVRGALELSIQVR